jgi:hypothetical protein
VSGAGLNRERLSWHGQTHVAGARVAERSVLGDGCCRGAGDGFRTMAGARSRDRGGGREWGKKRRSLTVGRASVWATVRGREADAVAHGAMRVNG